MRLSVLFLPLAMIAMSATAQTAAPPTATEGPPVSSGPSQTVPPDLDAQLHHQPTEGTVEKRERARFGDAAVQRQQNQEQAEIDRLNRELLGPSSSAAPK